MIFSARSESGSPSLSRNLVLLLALAASAAQAFTLNRNEAHIDWRTAETEHFRFHYAAELEPVAGYIAGIAEGVAETKMKRYQIRLPNKVEFLIREDIFSNGWANSLQNVMTVWISDWDFPIRSTHNWLKDVVTHEFSHLVSIQSSSKFASPIQGLVIGYQDYYNEDVQSTAATIIPFTSQPNWFAEGVAQYESELSGYDAWDSHRDMLLRTAALHGKLLSYDRMGTFAGTSLEYESGPYTQGFAFTRWLAARYGDPAIIRLWAENSRLHRQTLSGSMERVLGKDAEDEWRDWKNAITAQYADQVKALGPLRTGKKLTSKGFYNYYPRWDHKGENLFFVSNRGRDDFKGALWMYKLGDTAKKEEDRLKMLGPVRSPFDVAPDDSTILYHSAKNVDKNGMNKLDIYQRNVRREEPFFSFGDDPTERRYTKDWNAVQPSYDREGKRVVFVRNRLTNFQICVANVPDAPKARGKGRADVDSEDVKVIFPADSVLQGRFGFQIYSPRFSPDGKDIAFSYYIGESRNIGIVHADGSGFHPLLDRPYDERDPEWAPDGSALYFSADSNAIYNIYRVALSRDGAGAVTAGAPEALTQVTGGAFAPAIDPTGTKLAYSGYDTTGFSLYLLDGLKPAGAPPTALRILHPQDEKVEPIDFEGKSEKYLGVPTRWILTPLLIGEEMSSTDHSARRGEPKWLAGANGVIDDPVGQNEVSAALLLQMGKGLDYFGANSEIISPDKESQFYLSWVNRATPVTLDLSFARGNLASHDTVTVRDKGPGAPPDTQINQNYAVIYRNLEAGLSYNLFDAGAVEDDSHSSFVRLAGGYAWNDFDFYDFPFAFQYFKNLYLSALANIYSSTYSDKELVAPHGLAAALAYTYDRSGIVRKGTFFETFEVSSNGVVTTKFRDYDLHDLDAGATYGIGLPWSDNGSFLVSGFAGSLLDWSVSKAEAGTDTLDTFFAKGLFLRGYPFLRDIENLSFQGENTLKLSADINQPILPDIYKSYWVLFVEDLYVNAFWEAGRAWNGSLWDARLFDTDAWRRTGQRDGWYQTVGWGLKLNARIYNNYPFLAYFEAATALSGVPDGKGGQTPLETVKIPIGGRGASIDTYATRISFGVSFGFYNGLLGRLHGARNPNRPESPFARR
jgi:Tol biopolymer transport system component